MSGITKKEKCAGCTVGFLVVSGVLLLISGIVVYTLLPPYFISQIKEKLPLKNDSISFANWQNSSVPIYFRLYMFNLTNLEEFEAGEKPNIQELGPYTYLEKREKVSFGFVNNGEHLNYTERKYFIFQPELSKGDPLTDKVVTTNLLYAIFFANMEKHPKIEKIVNQLASTDFFMEKTVDELLWGYNDEIMEEICDFAGLLCDQVKMGLLKDSNGTDSRPTMINTGAKDIKKLGKIELYNNQSSLSIWNSDIANAINGSDGSMFPPFLKSSDLVYVFSADVCRSFKFAKIATVSATHDSRVELYSFTGTPDQAQNATVNPYNDGFCPGADSTPGLPCPPTGMMDLTPCKSKNLWVPIYASQPHFFLADPSIPATFTGMKAGSQSDQTVLHIQPILGLPLEAYKRLQMNMFFRATKKMNAFYKKIESKDYYFPLFWLEESAVSDAETLGRVYDVVIKKQSMINGVIYTLLCTGIAISVLAVIAIIVMIVIKRTYREFDKVSTHAEEDLNPTEKEVTGAIRT